MEYDYESMIQATYEQKPIDFTDKFHDIMLDKISSAINNKKIELSHNLFRTVENPKDINIENETEE